MLRCPELKRLPKPSHYKSINFRSQTPGSIFKLLGPSSRVDSSILDPTHPAVSLPRSVFYRFKNDVLSIAAYPMALLTQPDRISPPSRPIIPWKDRIEKLRLQNNQLETKDKPSPAQPPVPPNPQKSRRIPMSFVCVTTKKKTSSKKTIRHKIMSNLKTAINLIVIRGANTVETDGVRKLVLNEKEVEEMADRWILQGWTYIFFPTLEVYRVPYHDLIPILRTGLEAIWTRGHQMEKQWETRAIKSPAPATKMPAMVSKHKVSR